jgi:hypothetical protein
VSIKNRISTNRGERSRVRMSRSKERKSHEKELKDKISIGLN